MTWKLSKMTWQLFSWSRGKIAFNGADSYVENSPPPTYHAEILQPFSSISSTCLLFRR